MKALKVLILGLVLSVSLTFSPSMAMADKPIVLRILPWLQVTTFSLMKSPNVPTAELK